MAPGEISGGILLTGKEEVIFDLEEDTRKRKGFVEQGTSERPAFLYPKTVRKVFTSSLGQTHHSHLSVAGASGKLPGFGSPLIPPITHPFGPTAPRLTGH